MVEQDQTIRKDNWKLMSSSRMGDLHVNYRDDDYAKFRKIKCRLYDLANDPSETTSLYNKYRRKWIH
jgi:hypothetical protein